MIDWSRVVGQNQAIELLQRVIQCRFIAPAYLFAGANGVGRTLAAKCFARELLTLDRSSEEKALIDRRFQSDNHPDFIRVEPTYQHQGELYTAREAREKNLKRKASPIIRIEQIREITEFLGRPPLEADRFVVTIEEAHTMTEAAANALLKTLEEPNRATFILIAPGVDSLLPTVVSRCQCIPFRRLGEGDFKKVIAATGHDRLLDYPTLIDLARGSPGEAISSLAILDSFPDPIPLSIKNFPRSLSGSLELAKFIAGSLDLEVQLWYVDYLQSDSWRANRDPVILNLLENTRKYLKAYVQPRLVWECTVRELVIGNKD